MNLKKLLFVGAILAVVAFSWSSAEAGGVRIGVGIGPIGIGVGVPAYSPPPPYYYRPYYAYPYPYYYPYAAPAPVYVQPPAAQYYYPPATQQYYYPPTTQPQQYSVPTTSTPVPPPPAPRTLAQPRRNCPRARPLLRLLHKPPLPRRWRLPQQPCQRLLARRLSPLLPLNPQVPSKGREYVRRTQDTVPRSVRPTGHEPFLQVRRGSLGSSAGEPCSFLAELTMFTAYHRRGLPPICATLPQLAMLTVCSSPPESPRSRCQASVAV